MVEKINAALKLGPVHLRSADLQLQAEFYQSQLGLKLRWRDGAELSLGTESHELLRLHEQKNTLRYRHVAGLYHFCIAVEERASLGGLLKHLITKKAPLDGLVDHRMAEAIYLKDAEGNGIELNWDRPREAWRPWSEWLAMGNAELDVEGLLGLADQAAQPFSAIEASARIGHIHLHVGDLAAAKRFYLDVVGFDQTTEIPGQAVFTSAGGYHHHIAFNLWAGRNIEAAPGDAIGLQELTLFVPGAQDLEALKKRALAQGLSPVEGPKSLLIEDPWQHRLNFVIAES